MCVFEKKKNRSGVVDRSEKIKKNRKLTKHSECELSFKSQ